MLEMNLIDYVIIMSRCRVYPTVAQKIPKKDEISLIITSASIHNHVRGMITFIRCLSMERAIEQVRDFIEADIRATLGNVPI